MSCKEKQGMHELRGAWRKITLRKPSLTYLPLVILVFAVTLLSMEASAQTGYTGIFGGGPLYKHVQSNITEIQNSGFNEVIVWSVEVKSNGDLNFNGEFPLTSNGVYIGNQTFPNFASDLAAMKQGAMKRITFSIGSSNIGDWQDIEALVNSQGTGPDSILFRDFQALKAAIPSLDAIDFDDENNQDLASTVAFAVMLGKLGYHVTPDAFGSSGYWESVVSQVNSQLPATIDGVHLQTYAGGTGNNPCSGWNFGNVPVLPGLWDLNDTPNQVQVTMGGWHSQCGILGGFLWLYDDIVGRNEASQYASAINTGVSKTASTGPSNPPAVAVFNNNLYVAYQANDSSRSLYVTSSNDGVHFSNPVNIPGITVGGAPALAVYNNKLYIAFQANDASHSLWTASSTDGVHFSNVTHNPGITMGSAPALAVYNNELYIAFQANDASHSLWVASSPDGLNFANVTNTSSISLGSAPALAVFDNKLCVAFQANDSGHVLWAASSTDGLHFTNQTQSPGITLGSAPALSVLNNKLYIAFQANDEGHQMWVASSTDGVTFTTPINSPGVTMGSAPGMSVFNNKFFAEFQANDPNHDLSVASSADGLFTNATTLEIQIGKMQIDRLWSLESAII
jgi:frataxin-like iron-binding protein CyaY